MGGMIAGPFGSARTDVRWLSFHAGVAMPRIGG